MNLSDGKCTHSVSTENLKQCDLINNVPFVLYRPGANPGFQVRGGGAHFKKLRRAEGGANIFGVFRI